MVMMMTRRTTATSTLLLILVALSACGMPVAAQRRSLISMNDASDSVVDDDASSQRRELWDFWSLAAEVGKHLRPCPPVGEPREKCLARKASQSAQVTGDNTDVTADDAGDGDADYAADEQAADAQEDAGDSGVTYAQDEYISETATGGSTIQQNTVGGFNLWLLAAIGAVGLAVVAIHLGQRKNPVGRGTQQLSAGGGAVARRAGMARDAMDTDVEVRRGFKTTYSNDGDIEMRPGDVIS